MATPFFSHLSSVLTFLEAFLGILVAAIRTFRFTVTQECDMNASRSVRTSELSVRATDA